jgi:hypothetical protein
MNTTNFKTNPTTIFELSNRTIQKIISRADLSCSICKWNEATGDIHHIVDVALGGTNEMTNLIYVCPNCHRQIHQQGDNFKTRIELFKTSLEKTLPNWLDFYNPQITKVFPSLKTTTNKCLNPVCNINVAHNKKYCSATCSYTRNQKFEWTKDLLTETLKEFNCNLTKCGHKFNVSDNAFKKQCIKFNIVIKDYKLKTERTKVDKITII